MAAFLRSDPSALDPLSEGLTSGALGRTLTSRGGARESTRCDRKLRRCRVGCGAVRCASGDEPITTATNENYAPTSSATCRHPAVDEHRRASCPCHDRGDHDRGEQGHFDGPADDADRTQWPALRER